MQKKDIPEKARSADSPDLSELSNSMHLQAIDTSLDESDDRPKRAKNPRKRFEHLAPGFSKVMRSIEKAKRTRNISDRSAAHHDEKKKAVSAAIRELLVRAIATAAERADLNVEDELDREILICMLAFAIYGGKGPGREKSWDDGRLNQLLADYDVARLGNPNLKTEEDVCKYLCSRKSGFPQYHTLQFPTLRRRLQDAKTLRRLGEAELKTNVFLAKSQLFGDV
jgi:hypothetical protein